MKSLGPRSSPNRLLKQDGRTKLAKATKTLRSELVTHAGGNPSITQKLLIDRIVELQQRLWLMEAAIVGSADMEDGANRRYLAWSAALSRLLRQLGMKGAPTPKVSLAEHLAQRGGSA